MDAMWPAGEYPTQCCVACGSLYHRVEWLGPAEAAAHLGNAPQTLANWRSLGKGPECVKHGRTVRYAKCWLDGWLLSS